MKKRNKILLFLLTVFSSIFGLSLTVNAQTTTEHIKNGPYVGGPYYIVHAKGTKKNYLQGQFIVRTSDGHFVYCVQPMTHIDSNADYNLSTEDIAATLAISPDTWDMMSRIAYYGYGYKENGIDHTDDRYYLAAQMLIWQYADPTVESYFTKTLNGTRDDTILKSQMDEIMVLVNNHKTRPNLTGIPESLNIGQTVTIIDSNNVLQYYQVDNVVNGNVAIEGNTLKITATNTGNISFNLNRNGNKYGYPVELYFSTGSQNVIRRRDIDPITINASIKVYGAKVKLKKVDKDTNSNSSLGQATLSGAKYGIYDENNNLIQTLTTDISGFAESDYLPAIGRYYLKEISSSNGYNLDEEKHWFDVNENNLNIEIISKEKVIKNRIKVYKVDSENNTCTAQGQATLSGAKYGVYDWNNQLVDTLTIGSDCTATSKELPYGKYYVKELQSSTGYYKDENTYNVNINNEVMLKVTSKENVIKSNIKIKKVDSENNTCTAQGQGTLSGAKYGVYDWNKKLVDTIVIKNDCTGTSINLPYGNYTVKEIESSTGYQLDTNTYEANINSNSIINITSKEKVYKNYISILKQYDYVDGNSTFLNVESGITFDIYYPNGNKYGSVTTDKNGYAEFEIAYGTWKLHQVNTNTGFRNKCNSRI